MTTSTTLPIGRRADGSSTTHTGWLPLAVLLTGIFLVVLDFFIVNVALPSLQQDLHTDDTAIEWIVAGYGLTFGALLMAAGRFGARWGRRRVYLCGVALFVAASAACGVAPGVDALIAARLVQGVGAAMLAPLVLALIGDLYDGPRRLRALGIYATVMGVAAASGQLLGGLLIALDPAGLGWRSVFLVNVPVGAAVLVLGRRLLPASRGDSSTRIDVTGVALLAVAITAILLPLLEGRQSGWAAWIWVCLAAGLLLLAVLARRSLTVAGRGGQPLVDPVAFTAPAVRRGLVCQAVLFCGMASYFLVLALYLQAGLGLGPLASGVVFTAVAVPYMVGTSKAGLLVERLGTRAVALGAAAFALGHLLLLAGVGEAGGSVAALLPGLVIGGAGMGVCLSALVATVMAGVSPEHAATVSGALSTVQQVGNAVGVALIGVVFFAAPDVRIGFEHSLDALAGAMALLAAVAALPARQGRD
jgi:EmrB/QacA subfamily drug resistance transporter